MKFYSGFCFKNEKELFKDYVIDNSFTVAGFSYGAKFAIEYANKTTKRVDKLILLSPIYFQDRDEKFKKEQLKIYKQNNSIYMKYFYKNVIYPCFADISAYKSNGNFSQLKDLLYYKYDLDILQNIINKGIKIEVYLGAEDKIINSDNVSNFFKKFATVYLFNGCGHLLMKKQLRI